MQHIISWVGILRRFGQKVGPFFMLEMLLPGGTVFALLFFLYQRRKPDVRTSGQRVVDVLMRALAGVFERRILVPAPVRVAVRMSKSVAWNDYRMTRRQ